MNINAVQTYFYKHMSQITVNTSDSHMSKYFKERSERSKVRYLFNQNKVKEQLLLGVIFWFVFDKNYGNLYI